MRNCCSGGRRTGRPRFRKVVNVTGPDVVRYKWGKRLAWVAAALALFVAFPTMVAGFSIHNSVVEVAGSMMLLLAGSLSMIGCCLFKTADVFVDERLEHPEQTYRPPRDLDGVIRTKPGGPHFQQETVFVNGQAVELSVPAAATEEQSQPGAGGVRAGDGRDSSSRGVTEAMAAAARTAANKGKTAVNNVRQPQATRSTYDESVPVSLLPSFDQEDKCRTQPPSGNHI